MIHTYFANLLLRKLFLGGPTSSEYSLRLWPSAPLETVSNRGIGVTDLDGSYVLFIMQDRNWLDSLAGVVANRNSFNTTASGPGPYFGKFIVPIGTYTHMALHTRTRTIYSKEFDSPLVVGPTLDAAHGRVSLDYQDLQVAFGPCADSEVTVPNLTRDRLLQWMFRGQRNKLYGGNLHVGNLDTFNYAEFHPVKLSLHSADPGLTGAHEISGRSYVRFPVPTEYWSVPSNASIMIDRNIDWQNIPTATISHVGIWDKDGNFMMGIPLPEPVVWIQRFTGRLRAGQLRIQLGCEAPVPTVWELVGGHSLNGSWDSNGLTTTNWNAVNASLLGSDGKLYVALGDVRATSASVWRYTIGGTWEKVGGQGQNGSWNTALSSTVHVLALAEISGTLYAGLGSSGIRGSGGTSTDGEVWAMNMSTGNWTKIGGDGLNAGWTGNYETAGALAVVGTTLYVGLGNSAQDAEVYSWNGTSWTKVGGDGVNSSWTAAGNYERVMSFAVLSGLLYAGLGTSSGDSEVWRYNPGTTTWTKVGGDGVNSSWTGITRVHALCPLLGKIYAALSDGSVWAWTVGGNWANTGTAAVGAIAESLVAINGMLFAGFNGNTDPTENQSEVWMYDPVQALWEQVGGNDILGSWNNFGGIGVRTEVFTLVDVNGILYAGVSSAGEVWKAPPF